MSHTVSCCLCGAYLLSLSQRTLPSSLALLFSTVTSLARTDRWWDFCWDRELMWWGRKRLGVCICCSWNMSVGSVEFKFNHEYLISGVSHVSVCGNGSRRRTLQVASACLCSHSHISSFLFALKAALIIDQALVISTYTHHNYWPAVSLHNHTHTHYTLWFLRPLHSSSIFLWPPL